MGARLLVSSKFHSIIPQCEKIHRSDLAHDAVACFCAAAFARNAPTSTNSNSISSAFGSQKPLDSKRPFSPRKRKRPFSPRKRQPFEKKFSASEVSKKDSSAAHWKPSITTREKRTIFKLSTSIFNIASYEKRRKSEQDDFQSKASVQDHSPASIEIHSQAKKKRRLPNIRINRAY